MRVLLVYPNITGHESTHQGLMSISAYLQQQQHTISLIDFTLSKSTSSHLSKVIKFKPDLVGFTATSGMFKPAIEFASLIKTKISVPIIFGGPHATVVPENVIKEQAVDIICINEGEEASRELLHRMANGEDYLNIQNLWVKQNSTIYKNPVRPLISDLDTLPFPHYDLFDMETYLSVRNGAIDMITGRGCPYQCTYCINHEIQQIQCQKGKEFIRKNSVDYVIQHIASVINKYHVRFIAFEDDLFTMHKEWVIEFSKHYKKYFSHIPFSCNNRVETGNERFFKYLKEAGCVNVHMGIESGDENIRKVLLKRNMSDKKIFSAFESAKHVGLKTTSYNILGLPFETEKQIKKTITLNRKLKPDHIGVSIFCPYPGTHLYKLCVKDDLIDPDFEVPYQHRSKVILKYGPKLKKKIKFYKKYFRFMVYKNYNLKKAIIFLIFDNFYDLFISIRNRIPVILRNKMFRVYYRLIGH